MLECARISNKHRPFVIQRMHSPISELFLAFSLPFPSAPFLICDTINSGRSTDVVVLHSIIQHIQATIYILTFHLLPLPIPVLTSPTKYPMRPSHTEPDVDPHQTVMPDFKSWLATLSRPFLSSQPWTARAARRHPQTPIKAQRYHYDKPTRRTSYPPVYQGTLCRDSSCHFFPQKCEQRCRCQRKYVLGARPEQCSGRNAENASRRSRVSECRMPSTSSLGHALFRNRYKSFDSCLPFGLRSLPPPARWEGVSSRPRHISYHIPIPSGRGRLGMHKNQKTRSARGQTSQTVTRSTPCPLSKKMSSPFLFTRCEKRTDALYSDRSQPHHLRRKKSPNQVLHPRSLIPWIPRSQSQAHDQQPADNIRSYEEIVGSRNCCCEITTPPH